jgi:hypothetical protein
MNPLPPMVQALCAVAVLLIAAAAPAAAAGAPAAADAAMPSKLAHAAASMRPGEVKVLHRVGDSSGFSERMLYPDNHHYLTEYASKGLWDPLNHYAEFLGAGHLGTGHHLRYREHDDRWDIVRTYPILAANDPYKSWLGHGYEHSTLDPSTGDIYLRHFNQARFQRLDKATGKWSPLPTIPGVRTSFASALTWFPELGGLIFVDTKAGIWLLRAAAESWERLAAPSEAPMNQSPNHQFAVYNPIHRMVLLGGGNDNRRAYRLSAKGELRPAAEQPQELGPKTGAVTVDPVSGDFLAFTFDRHFYSYDPLADRWTDLSATLAVHPVDFTYRRIGVFPAIPIYPHGVIMFIAANRDASRILLYRHRRPAEANSP